MKQCRLSRVLVCRAQSTNGTKLQELRTKICIVGSGPAAHTAAIYTARAELQPILFEGFMANGIAPGGQLTTTSFVENFPGFHEPIMGIDLVYNMRKQSMRYGTTVYTETVTKVDLQNRPFTVWTDEKVVKCDVVVVATGASAKKLRFKGSGEGADGYWQKGISACAICDGGSPLMRNKPVAVVGGGDAAMEEAMFLTKYASKVYVIHRFDYLEASKVMQRRAMTHPKIEIVWHHEVVEAYGNEEGFLGGVKIMDNESKTVKELPCNGLFFAIGHKPATDFLEGQLTLDEFGYVITGPDSTTTNIAGVFAAGDVQDRRWRQAITAAASGCMAALEAEAYLQQLEAGEALRSDSFKNRLEVSTHSAKKDPVPPSTGAEPVEAKK